MAFTAEQKLKICRILEITQRFLNSQITYLGADLTADVETAVIEELDRWETAGFNFVRIHPKEANFGAEINPADAQNDIKRNIAVLLELTSSVSFSDSGNNMGTIQIGC
jgi:hypothetical protein